MPWSVVLASLVLPRSWEKTNYTIVTSITLNKVHVHIDNHTITMYIISTCQPGICLGSATQAGNENTCSRAQTDLFLCGCLRTRFLVRMLPAKFPCMRACVHAHNIIRQRACSYSTIYKTTLN